MLNRPDLIDDPTYVERLDDPSFGPEIDKLFLPWALARTKREVMFEAQAEGLGAAAIYTMEDVVNDPHLRERNFFQSIYQYQQ